MDERQGTRNSVISVILTLLLTTSVLAQEHSPRRVFHIDAGDASVTLTQFSRQSDLQLLFDYNVVLGIRTDALNGEWEPSNALKEMLKGTQPQLVFEFVNGYTVMVTPKTPTLGCRMGMTCSSLGNGGETANASDTPEVLVATNASDKPEVLVATEAPEGKIGMSSGSSPKILDRQTIDLTGLESTSELIDTIPSLFRGGPGQDTYLGREAATNAAKGVGFNVRGLDAGSVVVLVDGHRMAMSGTAGGWQDISNLPLGHIQDISIISDSPSLAYGADTVSGVVNFSTRRDVEGLTSKASIGTATDGGLGQRTFDTTYGHKTDSGLVTLSFEYSDSQALPARDRGQATSDLQRWGGPNYDTPFGSPGTLIAGGQTWAIQPVSGHTEIVPGAQNLYDLRYNGDVFPSERLLSLSGRARETIHNGIDLWADSWLSRRHYINMEPLGYSQALQIPSTNPYYLNPAHDNQPVTVLYGFGQDLGRLLDGGTIYAGNLAVGADLTVGEWRVSGSVGYAFEHLALSILNNVDLGALATALADSNPDTAFDAFGGKTSASTLNGIRTTLQYHYQSVYKTLTTMASRSLWDATGGNAALKLGGEFRQQTFDSVAAQSASAPILRQTLSRNLSAAFGEVVVPIYGPRNRQPLREKLELSVGARIEDYGSGLRAFVPRFGARWTLLPHLSLRGTWGRSVRPPNLTDVTSESASEIAAATDRASPTGTSTALFWAGNNPDLRAERSTNSSFGLDINFSEGGTLAVTYFRVSSSNRVVQPELTPDSLNDPKFQGIVIRHPTQAQIATVCGSSSFHGDPASCLSTRVDVLVDGRLQNVQKLTTDGFDVLGRYAYKSAFGRWDLGLQGTYLLSYDLAQSPGNTLRLLSTQNNPNRFRMRDTLSWTRHGLSMTAFANYTNRYSDTNDPGRTVASWTTIDGQVAYQIPAENAEWKMQLALSVQNIFNRYPPYLSNPIGLAYDPELGDLTGRFVSARLNLAF